MKKNKNLKSKKGKMRKQICLKGHNTFEYGRTKDGHCMKCRKEYRIINSKQISEQKKEYRKIHAKEISKQKRKYHKRTAKRRLKYNKEYLRTHKKQMTAWLRKYCIEKYANDLNYKLKHILRTRLGFAIKNIYKVGSAVRDLGCPIEFLIAYIQEQFYANMTWDNYGTYWQIDHIVPFWKFDLTNKKQFKQAVHYTNLQPLTIPDHKKKTAKEIKSRHRFIKQTKEK